MDTVKALVPGTFDPITIGHYDVIERVSKLYSKVYVGVAVNSKKNPLFNIEERIHLIKKSIVDLPNVEVVSVPAMVVRYAEENNINIIVRGLRTVTDFLSEFQMAEINQSLCKKIETSFMVADSNLSKISSSLVKELFHFGEDISPYVHKHVAEAIIKKYRK